MIVTEEGSQQQPLCRGQSEAIVAIGCGQTIFTIVGEGSRALEASAQPETQSDMVGGPVWCWNCSPLSVTEASGPCDPFVSSSEPPLVSPQNS